MRRRHFGSLAIGAAMIIVAACGDGASAHQGCNTGIVISDGPTLRRLAACASAGTNLSLARDAYFGTVVLTGRGVVIRSVDPQRPARFSGLVLRNGNAVTLRDLAFTGAGGNGQKAMLSVVGGSGIRLEQLRFTGDTASFRPELETAVSVRNAGNVAITGSRIEGYRNGITLRDSGGISVVGNSIRRMQTDGIRASGVQGLRIARNVIASFSPAPRDHPDGVQLWSRNPAEASSNVTVEENLILRGNGAPVQGIFLRATKNAPFRNVSIRNNLIVGQIWNGIAVMGASGVEVCGNSILPLGGQMSWLRLTDSTNANVSGNQAGRYVITGGSVRQSGNAIASVSATRAARIITQWREQLSLPETRFPQ